MRMEQTVSKINTYSDNSALELTQYNYTTIHRFVSENKEQLYAHSGSLPFNLLVKHRIGLLMYKLSNDIL